MQGRITIEERSENHTIAYLVEARCEWDEPDPSVGYEGGPHSAVVEEIEEITIWPDVTKRGYVVDPADWSPDEDVLAVDLTDGHAEAIYEELRSLAREAVTP